LVLALVKDLFRESGSRELENRISGKTENLDLLAEGVTKVGSLAIVPKERPSKPLAKRRGSDQGDHQG
jgi:hypothetical protein